MSSGLKPSASLSSAFSLSSSSGLSGWGGGRVGEGNSSPIVPAPSFHPINLAVPTERKLPVKIVSSIGVSKSGFDSVSLETFRSSLDSG